MLHEKKLTSLINKIKGQSIPDILIIYAAAGIANRIMLKIKAPYWSILKTQRQCLHAKILLPDRSSWFNLQILYLRHKIFLYIYFR